MKHLVKAVTQKTSPLSSFKFHFDFNFLTKKTIFLNCFLAPCWILTHYILAFNGHFISVIITTSIIYLNTSFFHQYYISPPSHFGHQNRFATFVSFDIAWWNLCIFSGSFAQFSFMAYNSRLWEMLAIVLSWRLSCRLQVGTTHEAIKWSMIFNYHYPVNQCEHSSGIDWVL